MASVAGWRQGGDKPEGGDKGGEHERTTTLLFSAWIACALFSLINVIRSSTVGFCDWMIRFGSEPGMDIGSLVRHGSLAGVHQVGDLTSTKLHV